MNPGTLLRLALRAALAFAALATLPASAQKWTTLTSARQHLGEKKLDLRLEYGPGTLKVARGSDDLLYRFQVRYDEDRSRPVTEFDRARGALRLGLASGEESRKGHGSRGTAELTLPSHVSLALDLRFGAGKANVDLGGLTLRTLQLSTGASETRVSFDEPNRTTASLVEVRSGAASLEVVGLGNARAERFDFEGGVGETTLDFGGEWNLDASASVRIGVGSLKLRFPRELGVRIVRESFLTSFDGEGLVKRGDAFYSENWENAPRKLTVTIEAALGAIDVDWMD